VFGTFGSHQFGAPWFIPVAVPGVGGKIALLGDLSDHGGSIITTNQDGKFLVAGIAVAVAGALHSCPIEGHGITSISATTSKSFCNGKLILTEGAVAGCMAILQPVDRGVYVE